MSHFPYFVLFSIFIAPPFLTLAKQVPKYCEKGCAPNDNTDDVCRAGKPHEKTCYADPEGSDKLLLLQWDQKWSHILRKALDTCFQLPESVLSTHEEERLS